MYAAAPRVGSENVPDRRESEGSSPRRPNEHKPFLLLALPDSGNAECVRCTGATTYFFRGGYYCTCFNTRVYNKYIVRW
jgi:hypothetical protein